MNHGVQLANEEKFQFSFAAFFAHVIDDLLIYFQLNLELSCSWADHGHRIIRDVDRHVPVDFVDNFYKVHNLLVTSVNKQDQLCSLVKKDRNNLGTVKVKTHHHHS